LTNISTCRTKGTVVLEGVQENLSESVRTIVTEPRKGLAQRLSDVEELCLGLSKKIKSLEEKCLLNVNSQVPDKLANVNRPPVAEGS